MNTVRELLNAPQHSLQVVLELIGVTFLLRIDEDYQDIASGRKLYIVFVKDDAQHGPEKGLLGASLVQGGLWYWQTFVPENEFNDYIVTFGGILGTIGFHEAVPLAATPAPKSTEPNPPPETQPDIVPEKTLSAKDVAIRIFPSVVLLVMKDSHGSPISLGSGFAVSPHLIATNLHVLQGGYEGVAKVVGSKRSYAIDGVVATDTAHDLAIVQVSDLAAPILEIGKELPAVGETVYAAGNPEGLEGTFSQGLVSANRQEESLLQITAPISPGSSGGPIVNSRGVVVGVAVGVFESGQNLNFAIPAQFLADMLPHVHTPTKFPVTGKTTRTSSKSKPARRRSPVTGGELLWDSYLPGYYSFSIHNQSEQPIKSIYCQVVFYDRRGTPLDVEEIHLNEVIPPGLAKRASGSVDDSIHRLAASFEIRILDFSLE